MCTQAFRGGRGLVVARRTGAVRESARAAQSRRAVALVAPGSTKVVAVLARAVETRLLRARRRVVSKQVLVAAHAGAGGSLSERGLARGAVRCASGTGQARHVAFYSEKKVFVIQPMVQICFTRIAR